VTAATRVLEYVPPPRTGAGPRTARGYASAKSNGHRASIAASPLDAAGIPVRLIASGSVSECRRQSALLARFTRLP